MNESEYLNLLKILKQVAKAIKNNDIVKLRNNSDLIMYEASIYQDHYTISMSIIVYSLSKIFERRTYQEYKNWNDFYKEINKEIRESIKSLEKNDFDKFSRSLKNSFAIIQGIDKKIKFYVQEVVGSSKIKRGGNLYNYGISLGRTAELLEISKWDLMNYIGNVTVPDIQSKSIIDRYNFAKELFNIN